MGALHELKEFFHSMLRILCQIGIYIVVIRNGIRRAGLPFYDLFMGRGATFVGLPGSVSDDAGIPYVINAESPEILQGRGIDCGKFPASPQAGKHLVNQLFQTTSSGSS